MPSHARRVPDDPCHGDHSTARLRLQHFWGRLTANRGDGALVRLSTPIEAGDVEGARPRLYGLDVAFEQMVEDAWKTADAQPALSPTG